MFPSPLREEPCCGGFGVIEAVRREVEKGREMMVRPMDRSLTMEFKTGPGCPPNTKSLEDLTESHRITQEFQGMLGGKLHSVPVVEMRTMKAPMPDRRDQYKFKVGKDNTIDSEGLWMTMEDIREEMIKMYQDMVDKGERDPKNKIKSTAEYKKYNDYMDVHAEKVTKDAIERGLAKAGLPCLVVRGVKLERKSITNMQHLGLLTELPMKNDNQGKVEVENWEADLMSAIAVGSTLHIVLGEVKRKNWVPEEADRTLDKTTIAKAFSQLLVDVQFIQLLLADFPASSIRIHFLAAFPDVKVTELQNHFCQACLVHVVGEEDLADLGLLMQKVGLGGALAQAQVRSHLTSLLAQAEATEALLALSTRLFLNILHIGYRLITDIPKVEEARQKFIIDTTDDKIKVKQFVHMSKQQITKMEEAAKESKNVVITGGPGTGKTSTLLDISRRPADVLVVTSWTGTAASPLQVHLADMVQGSAATLVTLAWHDLLADLGLKQEDFKTGEKFTNGNDICDLPRLLVALCWALEARYPGLLVLLLVDEVEGNMAPVTGRPKHKDYTGLTAAQLPTKVTIALAINPSHQFPVLLTSPNNTFQVIECTKAYRSCIKIKRLTDRLAVLHPVGQERETSPATDVLGPMPRCLDLGGLEPGRLATELTRVLNILKVEGRGPGTVLYDRDLSPGVRAEVEAAARAEGWQVCRGGEYHGWENSTIVACGPGDLEYLTRARVSLTILLCHDPADTRGKLAYDYMRGAMQQAAVEGLVEEIIP